MGRIETVRYVCDWCQVEAKPEHVFGEDRPPEVWKEFDFHELLCPECQAARKEALGDARHGRLNSGRMGMAWEQACDPGRKP